MSIFKKQKVSNVLASPSSLSYNEETVKLCSWNIDGIRDENLENDSIKEMRIAIISSILLAEKPDVICIQENTIPMYSIIQSSLDNHYEDIEGGPKAGYFTSIFIKRDKKYKVSHQRISFAGLARSEMKRDLNIAIIELQNTKRLMLMTSHVESLANFEKARRNQLQIALEILIDSDCDYALLCGDLNIREKEAKDVLNAVNNLYILPNKGKSAVCDAWIKCGENINTKFTWTGKPFGLPHQKARYDRIYYVNKEGITPSEFRLIGTDTVEDITTTSCKDPLQPSDHFGLLCTFKFSNNPPNDTITRKPVDSFLTP
jgi:exonuclease III